MGDISQPFNLVKSGIAKPSGGSLQTGIPTSFKTSGFSETTPNTGEVRYVPMKIEYPIIVTAMLFKINTGPASNANVRIGIYKTDTFLQPSGGPVYDSGNISVASGFTGIKTTSGLSISLSPGMYLKAYAVDVAMAFTAMVGPSEGINTSLNGFTKRFVASQAFGAYPTPGTAWTTYDHDVTGCQHVCVWQWTE